MTDQPEKLVTPAIEALDAAGVAYTVVRTEIARSAEESATFQGIPGGASCVSIPRPQVGRRLPVRPRARWAAVQLAEAPPAPRHEPATLPTEEEAKAETGYVRGAITPFGARRPWPVNRGCAGIEALDVVRDRRRRAGRQRPPRRPRTSSRRPTRRSSTSPSPRSRARTPRRPRHERGAHGTARRHPRRGLLHGPRRAVLHDAPRGPRRGRDQGRAARGRRHPRLGPAVGRDRRRRHADRRLLPRGQPQQALDPARPRRRPGARSSAASLRDADVLVENYRVGGFARLGFGDEVAPGAQPGPRPPRDLRVRAGRTGRRQARLRLRRPGGRRADVDHRRSRRRTAARR